MTNIPDLNINDEIVEGRADLIEELNARCDILRKEGILSVRGDKSNYWAVLIINGDDEVCTTLESGFGHKSFEDAVNALFYNFVEWL